MSALGLEIAHHLIEAFLVLGLTEASQMRVAGRDGRIAMAEVDLELTEVLALLKEMRRVGMAKGVYVRLLLDAAGLEGETEATLQGGATQRTSSRGRSGASAATFGREQERGVAMGFPQLAEQFEGALGQGHVAISIALATADVEEHAFGIDVAHLQAQAFTQTKPAGVDRSQANAMIQTLDLGEDAADFLGRENHRQLELGISAHQVQFVRPLAFESLFPEELEGADELRGCLTGDLLDRLEVNAVLADLLEGEQLGRAVVVLTELADTGVVGLFGAGADRQEL
jgi:hypothetical protein